MTKQPNPNAAHINALRNQKRSFGMIKFTRASAQNFAKWESKSENLVINCFGEKSNQHSQYNHLVHGFSKEWEPMKVTDFKPKMKDLLSNFVDELELTIPDYDNGRRVSRTSGVKVITTVNQTTNVGITISQIVKEIKAQEPDAERANEAEKKLKELEAELKKEAPEWSKLKATLGWLLNFGRDAFLKVLPIILNKYGM